MAFNWYDPELHAGAASYAKEQGWILNTHMARTQQMPQGWRGDGVISLLSNRNTLEFVRSLQLPTIDIGGHYNDFPQVLGDHHATGRKAAEHFLERNHRHYVFFHIQSSRLEKEISSGFSERLAEEGLECAMRHWNKTGEEHEIHYAEVQKWVVEELEKLPRPLAVLCQNDDTAALVLTAAEEAGIVIPDEMAILGSGNSELVCDYLPVTLSSIESNLYGLGRQACIELDRLMETGQALEDTVRIPPGHVHVRASTDFLAVSNPHVLRVLREMWDNYEKPLNIPHLLSLVPISRSGLYNLFKDEIGLSMAKEIMRIRMRKACQLLADTRLSVSEIGERVGFRSLVSFSRAFSQNMGQSPSQYGKQFRREPKG